MMKLISRRGSELAFEKLTRSLDRRQKRAKRRWMHGRAFSASAPKRLLLVTVDEPVAQSQIDPFHHYAAALRQRYGVEVREVPIETYLRGAAPAAAEATVVGLQTTFDIPDADLTAVIGRLREQNPYAKLVYLDWFSPTDLRLAHRLDPHVDLYVKRHLLRDHARYYEPTYGDTNLMDHYCRRYALEQEPSLFPIPDGFFERLYLGPSFVTADYIRRAAAGSVPTGDRPLDLHARFGVAGTPWYRCMRTESVAALERVSDLRLAKGAGVHPVEYLRELRASKMCVSPFGYGEVCWRDYEAIISGTVLLKPEMSHVETHPDVFVAGETYVPLRWDFEDLEEKVRWLIERPDRRRAIAARAFKVLSDYVQKERFVEHMAPIFDPVADPRRAAQLGVHADPAPLVERVRG